MADVPINRYQPGGDIYNTLAAQYGTTAAQQVYQAALTNDRVTITETLSQIRNGPPLNDSIAANFLDQVTTDPLAAPLASLNKVVGNSVFSFLKNPWVLLAGGTILFFWLGGANLIRGWFKSKG